MSRVTHLQLNLLKIANEQNILNIKILKILFNYEFINYPLPMMKGIFIYDYSYILE